MTTIETNDEELEVDDDEPGYCPHCSGSGEGCTMVPSVTPATEAESSAMTAAKRTTRRISPTRSTTSGNLRESGNEPLRLPDRS